MAYHPRVGGGGTKRGTVVSLFSISFWGTQARGPGFEPRSGQIELTEIVTQTWGVHAYSGSFWGF